MMRMALQMIQECPKCGGNLGELWNHDIGYCQGCFLKGIITVEDIVDLQEEKGNDHG